MARCDTCLKAIDLGGEFYELENKLGTIAMLCSPSCLVEFAWKLKEGQPKLSKSKDLNWGMYQDMDGRQDCIDCRMDPSGVCHRSEHQKVDIDDNARGEE